ncbi:MAG: DUF6151 family protein [Polyangia bacterium]
MSHDAPLRCLCGEVSGQVTDASSDHVNRVICYCDDCQAFVHRLGRRELLDPHGGSDIIQVAPSSLRIDRGRERIVGLRLSPTGLYRFYASCCNTPLGNAVGPKLPFVGIAAACFTTKTGSIDDAFGPPIGKIQGKYAIGNPPAGSTGHNVRLLARTARLIFTWKLRGKSWPSPFFDKVSHAPLYPVSTLSQTERDALRPFCGPKPTAT